MRKTIALTLILLLAFSSVSFAAVSGSRSSRPSTGFRQSAPQSAPSSGYKPSAPAGSYSDKAPAAQAKPGMNQTPQQQPATGGFWRNAGFFGSGMLLGGLFGNMFGFGHMGFLSTIFGMLFNVIFLMAIFMAGRWVWNRLFGRDQDRRDRRNL